MPYYTTEDSVLLVNYPSLSMAAMEPRAVRKLIQPPTKEAWKQALPQLSL